MIDLPVNGTGTLPSLPFFYFLFLYFYYIINIYYLFHYFLFTIIYFFLLGMDSKCFLTSTDLQTHRARCQHQLSFLLLICAYNEWQHCNNIFIFRFLQQKIFQSCCLLILTVVTVTCEVNFADDGTLILPV